MNIRMSTRGRRGGREYQNEYHTGRRAGDVNIRMSTRGRRGRREYQNEYHRGRSGEEREYQNEYQREERWGRGEGNVNIIRKF